MSVAGTNLTTQHSKYAFFSPRVRSVRGAPCAFHANIFCCDLERDGPWHRHIQEVERYIHLSISLSLSLTFCLSCSDTASVLQALRRALRTTNLFSGVRVWGFPIPLPQALAQTLTSSNHIQTSSQRLVCTCHLPTFISHDFQGAT